MIALTATGILAVASLAVAENSRPWLGVVVDKVPEILSTHLKTGEGGVIVINVATGGPAERAGLQRYSVIVELDGKPVSGFVDQFIERISRLQAGESIALTVVQGGKHKPVELRLGERPPDDQIEWLHAIPDQEWSEEFTVRLPRIFRMEEDGNLIEEDVKAWKKWSDRLEQAFKNKWGWDIPIGKDMRINVRRHDDEVKVEVERGGELIRVERDKTGEITVTRTQKGGGGKGKVVVKEYANEEALAKGDPVAAEILQDTTGRGLTIERFFGPGKFKFDIDLNGFGVAPDQLRRKKDKLVDDIMRQWQDMTKELYGLPMLKNFRVGPVEPAKPDDQKPPLSFEVKEDGSIKVEVRKNGKLMKLHLKSEQELRTKHPALHKQFKEFIGGLG
jgi:hypothetical protein